MDEPTLTPDEFHAACLQVGNQIAEAFLKIAEEARKQPKEEDKP